MLTAAQLAVQEVNKNFNYFPKYEVVLDTGGNSTNTVCLELRALLTKLIKKQLVYILYYIILYIY